MAIRQFSFIGALMPFMVWALPVHAQINVCANSRPNWDASLGNASWITEALHILTSSGVLSLFVVMVLAIRFKNIWFTAVIAAASLVVSYFFYNAWTVSDPKSVMFRSILEGCVGPPYGAILVILAATCVMIGWQFFGKPRGATS